MAALRAGLARTFITPPRGSMLIGYGQRWPGSRGVRDPLMATALVLDDERRRLGLLCLDLLCLHEDVVERVRRRVADESGLAADALLLACSHTHAGPIAWAGPGSSRGRRRQLDRLVDKLVGVVAQAAATLAPACLEAGVGEARVAVNRREHRPDGSIAMGVNRGGAVDRSVGVLQLRDGDPSGALRAILVNFACHPTVLSPRNRRVSAEWPGVMRASLEAATGATCLFLQGAAGDLNPDHEWGEDDELAMQHIGQTVADAVLAAPLDPVAPAPLGFERAELPIPVQLRRAADGRVEPYTETVARLLRLPRFAVDPLLRILYPWRPRLRSGPEGRRELPMEVQVLRLGDLALVALAAEPFCEIGLTLKQRSPAPRTWLAGTSNGCIGYLPTAQAHREGGYEVEQAPLAYRISGSFDPGAADTVTQRSLAMIARLFSSAPPPAPPAPREG